MFSRIAITLFGRIDWVQVVENHWVMRKTALETYCHCRRQITGLEMRQQEIQLQKTTDNGYISNTLQ
jgi:hypothetical protein